MKDIKLRWMDFFGMIADPIVFVCILIALALIVVSATQSNPAVTAAFAFIASIFSAIAGGLLLKRWETIYEQDKLANMGGSAVRSLKLLLFSLSTLDDRVNEYLKRHREGELTAEVYCTYFEEVIGKCAVMKEETVKAIEDWSSAVPEIEQITTQIGIINQLRSLIQNTIEDRESVERQLQESEGKSEQERQQLKEQLAKQTNTLKELERKLHDRSTNLFESDYLNNSVIGTTSTSSIYRPLLGEKHELNLSKMCRFCNMQYSSNVISGPDKCPHCGKDQSWIIVGK